VTPRADPDRCARYIVSSFATRRIELVGAELCRADLLVEIEGIALPTVPPHADVQRQ